MAIERLSQNHVTSSTIGSPDLAYGFAALSASLR